MKFSFRIMGTRQSHLIFILGWTVFLITECKGSLTIHNTNPNVTVIEKGEQNYIVSMDENNHAWKETEPTLLFKVTPDSGDCSRITTSFLPNSYQFKYILGNDCIFKANQSFDYETPSERDYTFTLTDSSNMDSVGIRFTINNIDDEPPQLGSLKCEMDEYTIYSVTNSSCKVTILDPDGWLAKMTLTVNKGEADEDTIFNLDYKDTPADTVYEDDLFLFNNVILDYAKRTAYLFSITVTDSGSNSANQTAIVNVKDLRNVKPIWTKSLQFEEIDEKTIKEYEVTAIDGDTGIHEKINYFKEKEDDKSANYISIDEITGKITVTKINRDKDDITTYSFTLKACIESNTSWCTPQDVTLLVKDINDNAPLIMANNYTNGTSPHEFQPTEKKEINIEFLENFDGKFNFSTLIKDIDTGENAQFSVDLFDTTNTYSQAFLIVPTAGYKEGNFQISVKNKTYLDYEDEVWRNFQFSVISTDTGDDSLNDEMLINVSLIDYNDELPIFNKTEYNASIYETAKSGTFVLQAHATDRDAEDKVLKMDILGSYAEKRFSINSDGNITVQVSDEYYLDFDVLSSIFFQVTATDNVSHVTTVPVTITILDVNNKPPTIEPKDSVNFDENQKNGVLIFEDIKASDPDTNATLVAWIDWDSSYVTKNSRRLEKNETILNAMQFLELNATTGRDISINVSVVNSNDDNPDKPDFEIFDSLYLNIVVQDLNTDPEFMQNNQTSAFFLVTLNDVNDNPPYFTDSDETNRTVQEVSSVKTAAGSITAIDPDISDTVSYYCECKLGEDYDWIEVDVNTGEFQVKNDKINADDPDYLYYINYTCIATDGVHNTSKPVDFYIIDTNNKNPDISQFAANTEFHVIEKAPKNYPVGIITPTDSDRDIPFHTVKCSIQFKDSNTCYDEFVFSDSYPENNNQIIMKNGNVSRDVPGTSPFTCYVKCTDNVNNERQQVSRQTEEITIKIILDDLNDNKPILQTSELSCSESLVKGQNLDETIIGMDIDEGLNAEIDFYIESIIKNNDNTNDYISYFNISIDDNDYVLNDTFKQVYLTVKKDLKGLYGSYTINLLLKDRGEEPLNSTGTIDLTIDKYNFAPPTINFPNDDQKPFYLLDSQEIGKPLASLNNSEELQDFDATDGATTDCSKWDVTFTFQLIQETGYSIDDIFYLDQKPNKPCTAQLQINKIFEKTDVIMKTYKMELTAWLNSTENEEIPGDQQYSTSTNITIIFVNQTIEPTFETQTWNLNFEENNTMIRADLDDRAAQYAIPDYETFSIFYYLVADNDIPRRFFDVNEKYGNISVIKEFFYDDYQQFQFQIVASNDKTNVSTDPRSYLSVTINVESTNRRVPKFVSNSFFGAIIPNGATSGNKVTEIQAYDEDYCDQGRLTFTITSKIICTGNGWENTKPDFYLTTSNDIASVYLNFSVESTMTGYCSFEVTVTDTIDQFHHGPHQNTTNTTIFLITTENIVDFRFMNNASTVVEKKKTMLDIITDELGYDSYDKLIEESKEDAQQYTKASLYFIEKNDDQVTPVTSIRILQAVGSTDGFTKLANALRVEELYLMSFPNTNSNGSNSEAVLKKWLIAVSAILACLCLALLITLIIKIRQLHKTISNLTTKQFGSQDSGLNRLGISAPTTNKHAIEGANPLYKNEEIKDPKNMNDFDTQR